MFSTSTFMVSVLQSTPGPGPAEFTKLAWWLRNHPEKPWAAYLTFQDVSEAQNQHSWVKNIMGNPTVSIEREKTLTVYLTFCK